MTKKNETVADRLRQFGKERFGSMAAFARALNIQPPSLQDYLNSRILPGNQMQEKLRTLGCNIEWLMTGNKWTIIDGRVSELLPVYDPFAGMSESKKKKLKKVLEELKKLDENDVERVAEIMRIAFGGKK